MAITSAQAIFSVSAAGTATRPLMSGTLTLGAVTNAMRLPSADIAFTGRAVMDDTQICDIGFDDLVVSASASVAATTTLAPAGDDNDILITALATGAVANGYSVELIDPAANDAALTVTTANNLLFTVSLATGGAGAITSTAASVITALNALPEFAALMVAANAPANDGTGVVTAIAAASLTGGLKKEWQGAALDYEGSAFVAPDEILAIYLHCVSGSASAVIDATTIPLAAGQKIQLANPDGIFSAVDDLTLTASSNATQIEVVIIAQS